MKTKLLLGLGLVVSLHMFACGGYASGESGYTAHEWGTFTSVQGGDGVQLEWNPFVAVDLPTFVYTRAAAGYGFGLTDAYGKQMYPSIVRMETPVIYFYSQQARTVDVRVDFPEGRITEWYPQATALGPMRFPTNTTVANPQKSFIEWKGVNVLARGTSETSAGKLIREAKESHYYPARETDANFVRMNAPKARGGTEYDNLLFYRGVGGFRAPLKVAVGADENTVTLSTTNAEPLSDLFVLTVSRGQARFQRLDTISSTQPQQVRLDAARWQSLSEARALLMHQMSQALVKQGLYAREAEAMVNTWQDSWFSEEGTRVLYLLSRTWTDRALPVQFNPAPKDLVRVMVGRSELIEPSVERALAKSIARYDTDDSATKVSVISDVKTLSLGRFLAPAVSRALGKNANKHVQDVAWKLAKAVHDSEQQVNSIAIEPASLRDVPKKTAQIPGNAVAKLR
jgi:hypothetical protein